MYPRVSLSLSAIKWERKAGIRNTPMLIGTGMYQDPSCDGIKYNLDFQDRFDADNFGKLTKLRSWEVNNITKGCYAQVDFTKSVWCHLLMSSVEQSSRMGETQNLDVGLASHINGWSIDTHNDIAPGRQWH
jgi:hypothetical protein